MSDFDAGFDLLPADDILTPDAELDEALGIIDDDGAISLVSDEDPQPQPFGRGWAFDFYKRQFIRGGSAPLEVSGYDQLRVWIEKTLQTARLAHPIYSDEYGVDNPWEPIGQPFSPGVAGRMERGIKEALKVHDRITDITDMTFDGSPTMNELYVSFTVVTDDEELRVATIPIGRSF